MNIIDMVCLRSVIIWTILTKVSIFSTSVGNLVLDIAGWLAVIFVDPFSLQISFLSFLEAFVWLEVVLFIQTRCTI